MNVRQGVSWLDELVTNSNVVVLLDNYTRSAVESVTYDALVKHVTVVTDIREISDANYGCEFVFFEPAVPAIVTPENLQFIVNTFGVRAYLIYELQAVADLIGPLATSVQANYSLLEWNLIYAVLHSDAAILEPYQRSRMKPLEFASLLENVPADLVTPINKLFLSYLALGREYRRLVGENARLHEMIGNYRSVGVKTSEAIKELRALFENVSAMNRTYCAMLSESYDVTFSGVYPDRPRVLYVKSISHLAGVDNLLMVLYSVLTKQYKVSCKVVKLVDSANATSLRYVPNVYLPLADSYSTGDVLTNDFLMSLGAYNVLMGVLMLNRSRLDYLIVHDLRGTMNSALDSSLYDLRLNEIAQDHAVLGEYENVLSDYQQAPFRWSFEDIIEFTGTNTAKITHHKTVASILDYLM